MDAGADSLTVMLNQWKQGSPSVREAVISLVYDDLRQIARYHLRSERPGHTLQQTALIHEVYLRLLGQRALLWKNRQHFFTTAGILMRRILWDYARRRNAEKRGFAASSHSVDGDPGLAPPDHPELVGLADALSDLERFDPRKARVVELRFFMGLTIDEIAAEMGVSVRTIHREWTVARAWLHAYLSDCN